jgi:hypothetical protein
MDRVDTIKIVHVIPLFLVLVGLVGAQQVHAKTKAHTSGDTRLHSMATNHMLNIAQMPTIQALTSQTYAEHTRLIPA